MKKLKYLILLLPLLSGCYNYRELNELGITTAVSIDYKTDNFYIIAEVVNPVKQQDASSSNNAPFVNYYSSAPTLQEAFRSVVLTSPRQLYAAQMEIIVLSENVINEHLEEVLEYFSREPEFRSEVKVIVARDNASTEAITLQTLLSSFSSSNILEALELQNKVFGITYPVTFNDMLNMYMNPNLEVTLPSIMMYGDANIGSEKENTSTTTAKAWIKIEGNIITKNNKIVGSLDDNESRMVSLINGKTEEFILNVPTDSGYFVFEPNRIKVKRSANIENNTVKLEIEGYSKIKEVNVDMDIKDKDNIKKINSYFNDYIEDSILNVFSSIRDKYNTDIFGFRELYYQTDYNYFNKHYINWYEDGFSKLKLDVKSNIRLYEKGNTLGGVHYERED